MSSAEIGARWYGPCQDGCSYFWDGQQYTGYDCTASPVYGWYGPYEDGCSYLWDGYQFIARDCSANTTTGDVFDPDQMLDGPAPGVAIRKLDVMP